MLWLRASEVDSQIAWTAAQVNGGWQGWSSSTSLEAVSSVFLASEDTYLSSSGFEVTFEEVCAPISNPPISDFKLSFCFSSFGGEYLRASQQEGGSN